MKLNVSAILVLFLLFSCFGSYAWADAAGDELALAQKRYESLLQSEERKTSKALWMDVISLFNDIENRYPNSPEAPVALFTVGCIYEEMFSYSITLGELIKAKKAFTTFLARYPSHEFSKDAKDKLREIEGVMKKNNLVRVSATKSPPAAGGEVTSIDDDDTPDTGTNTGGSNTDNSNDGPSNGLSDGYSGASPVPSPLATTSLNQVRFFSDTDHTRVVLDLTAFTTFTDAALPAEAGSGLSPRVYVDIFNARLSPTLAPSLAVNDGVIDTIRWAQKNEKTVRVVLDLKSAKGYQIFRLKDPHRVVIDIAR